MKLKLLLTFLTALSVINQSAAQGLPSKTVWEGKIEDIRIFLRISKDSLTNKYVAVFDSPDQGAMGLKVSELKVTNDSVTAFSVQIGGGFYGAFNSGRTELAGEWKQGGALPLVLKRVEKEFEIKRPQMPKAPFPYKEEKVIYYNADKSIQYGATLTLPDTNKQVPAVILITGSGQQDRDETLFGHKPFWVIADYLSRNGIAVLRVDDRGVGETTGEVMNATSLDFAEDVLVGMEYLKTHQGIDSKKIGLIGHSEGGIIAPMAAVQSKDVSFIVSLAGVGLKGRELMAMQLKGNYEQLGLNTEEVSRFDSLLNMFFDLSATYADNEELKPIFATKMKAWLNSQPEPFLAKLGYTGPQAYGNIDEFAARFFLPWMRYFLKYDPATTLTKIKIPVLVLNGEKDVQVSAQENLEGFKTLLTKAGNKNFKVIAMPGLNHLFQHAKTGQVNEYAIIEETISPEVLSIMRNWIKSL